MVYSLVMARVVLIKTSAVILMVLLKTKAPTKLYSEPIIVMNPPHVQTYQVPSTVAAMLDSLMTTVTVLFVETLMNAMVKVMVMNVTTMPNALILMDSTIAPVWKDFMAMVLNAKTVMNAQKVTLTLLETNKIHFMTLRCVIPMRSAPTLLVITTVHEMMDGLATDSTVQI